MKVAALVAVLLLSGCNPKAESSARAAKAKAKAKAKAEPLATIAKVLGKGHVPSSSPWASRAECERALEGREWPTPKGGSARVGTWNVRYFPDGSARGDVGARRLDLDWLACGIALLDVELLAVQEFKHTADARAAASRLIDELNRQTGRSYKIELARCESDGAPRPGIIYDAGRISVTSFETAADLSSDKRCSDSEVPGLTAYVRLAGGPDFHLIVVHAPAGNQRKDFDKRQANLQALHRLTQRLARSNGDSDVVVTGDFNTSGCGDCEPAIDSVAETRTLAESVTRFEVPLRLVPGNASCSFVLDDRPMLLDHFLVAQDMAEVSPSIIASISGYCGAAQCKDVLPTASAEKRLSDHCPVILELPRAERD